MPSSMYQKCGNSTLEETKHMEMSQFMLRDRCDPLENEDIMQRINCCLLLLYSTTWISVLALLFVSMDFPSIY